MGVSIVQKIHPHEAITQEKKLVCLNCTITNHIVYTFTINNKNRLFICTSVFKNIFQCVLLSFMLLSL